jgi:D-amino-acid dehydrogenase
MWEHRGVSTVVVVGGGVVGLSVAYACRVAGHEVVVIEAGRCGGGASAGNTGWVAPSLGTPLAAPGIVATGIRSALDPDGALAIRPRLDVEWVRWLWRFTRASGSEPFRRGVAALLELTRRSLRGLDDMRESGVRFEEHADGLLAVAQSDDGLHWFDLVFDELRALGFEGGLERLDGDGARALEPALGSAVRVATRTTIDRHVDPTSLADGLAAWLAANGGEVRERSRATGLAASAAGWAVALEGDDRVEGSHVVLCTALATGRLVRPLGVSVPILPAKGYSITVPMPEPAVGLPLYLCEPKLGLSPLERGLRIAGFFEIGARDSSPSARRARQLVGDTRGFLAHPEQLRADPADSGWAGFRPSTPDSLPLIGPAGPRSGLLLATGHGMLGITLAPATGMAVAELVSGRAPAWVEPFHPGRWG